MNAGPADAALLASHAARIEALALQLGLEFDPVDFELVPNSFMAEIAIYGLPVRMRHWSFGVRYIHQLMQRKMGHSHIFEVMFPGDPCHAYMAQDNTLAENTLVTAHVLGHADFARRNALFARFSAMAGKRILEQSAARARRIDAAWHAQGQDKVEAVLDAALALEQHVDIHGELYRQPYAPVHRACAGKAIVGPFSARYRQLPGEHEPPAALPERPLTPPYPEYDLLWFIARYAPELEDWERDIFLAVREESFYFYPVFACQIMNEGWASYWHARLLREADFLPPELYLAALKSHSDVVRPHAGERQAALALNPYHLGFAIWEHIIEQHGLDGRAASAATTTISALSATTSMPNWPTAWACSCMKAATTAKPGWPAATCTRSARRSWRPNTIMARRASRPPCSTMTAAWCCGTTTSATAAGWRWNRRNRCSTISPGSGAGP